MKQKKVGGSSNRFVRWMDCVAGDYGGRRGYGYGCVMLHPSPQTPEPHSNACLDPHPQAPSPKSYGSFCTR